MADEIMTLEGIFTGHTRKGRTNMAASFIDGITDDLMDAKGWIRGAKAAGGGAVGRLGFTALMTKMPWLKTKVAEYPTAALIGQGILGTLLGVLSERFIGESAAAGFIGGVSGDALAKLGNLGLAKIGTAGEYKLALGDGGVSSDALTPEERAFLRGGVGEVAVESGPYPALNEAAVEPVDQTISGLSEAEEAVLFS